jgi:hypothetical protein
MPLSPRAFFLGLLSVMTVSALATAEPPDKQQCADAYTQAQILRTKDRLVLAKKQLEVCTESACPAALRKDCIQWLSEVEQNLPLLEIDVVDPAGHALSTAHVTVDGDTVTNGQAVALDPGSHTLAADAPGMVTASQSLEIAKGEKRRTTLTLAPQPAAVAPPPSVHRPAPVLPIVLAGVGAVGIGGFIGFGIAGNSKRAELDAAACKPNCAPSDVDTIKTDYVIADVSLGIGLASLAAATVLFVVAASSPTRHPGESAWRSLVLGASPLPEGGGVVGVAGRFY